MSIELGELSYDELLDLNNRIIERLKILDATDALNAMMQFNVAARVRFDSPKHGMQTGILIKFNQKTVTVLTVVSGKLPLRCCRRWSRKPTMKSMSST